MVNYTVNSDIRTKTIFTIAALSIVTTGTVSNFLTTLSFNASCPSAFAIFGSYLWLFDRFIWRWPLIRKLHGIPYLGGEWKGRVRRPDSSGNIVDSQVSAFVQQTWTQIQLEIVGEQSRSIIRSLSMNVAPLSRKSLIYIYEVHPRAEMIGRNVRGDGCQELLLVDKDIMEGGYFSSKLRGGSLILKRNSIH